MSEFDASLLAVDRPPRVRASRSCRRRRTPTARTVFQRWAAMGVEHFSALGAEVEPVLVRDRADADDAAAAQAIGEADLVYLSGGKPGHLLESLGGTRGRRGAHATRTSAGRPSSAARPARWRSPGMHFDFRMRLMPFPLRWGTGLGFAPGAIGDPALRRVAGAVRRR